jgi:hypothetical protein
MGLIDDAESRSSRQLASATTIAGLRESTAVDVDEENAEAEQILLDSPDDTPLELYWFVLTRWDAERSNMETPVLSDNARA